MMEMLNKLQQNSKTFAHVKRHWLTIAFVLGFIVDNLTLNRVDQVFDNIILLTQVILAMGSMLVLYGAIAEKFPEKWCPPLKKYAPVVTQYAFGGLLSGMLIFYGRSGSWSDSWLFLLVILTMIYFNETIKDRSSRLVFNLGIFFVALFSYVVLVIPVFTGWMGPMVFVGSGVMALIVMSAFIKALSWLIPRFMAIHMRSVVFTIGTIFVSLNFLYFTNIIPPIPLSLKDVGIYHSVVRFENGDYQLEYEKGAWWQILRNSDSVFHTEAGNTIFCFASVFAPTRLATEIYHNWQYYDEAKSEWVSYSRTSYLISGGRGAGYRGYTLINTSRDGKWRCVVETERGQVLGRETFTVNTTEPAKELIKRID